MKTIFKFNSQTHWPAWLYKYSLFCAMLTASIGLSYGQTGSSSFTINGATFSVNSNPTDYQRTFSWSNMWLATYGGTCDCDGDQTTSVGGFTESGLIVEIGDIFYIGQSTPNVIFNSGRKENNVRSGNWTVALGPDIFQEWYVEGTAIGSGPPADAACTRSCTNVGSSGFSYLEARTDPIYAPTSVSASSTSAGGSNLSTIRVTWVKQTHIPNSQHGYKIYYRKTGTASFTQAGTVAGSDSYTFDVTGLLANTQYDIAVRTYTDDWGGHQSGLTAATGRTLAPAFTATSGEHSTKVVLDWDNLASGISDLRLKRSKPTGGFEEIAILNKNATAYTDTDALPGFGYTYKLCPLDGNGNELVTFTTTGYRKSNGVIKGSIRATGGAGVQGVQVCAVPTPAVSPAGATAPPVGGYCATTDANGKYEIREIYYYDEATFVVTPSFSGHKFGPLNQNIILDINSFTAAPIDFVDSTSVSIFGKVHFPPASQFGGTGSLLIGVKDAIIKVDTIDRGIRTDQNGNWSYAVTSPGNVSFSVEYLHHAFDQSKRTITVVDQDISNINFIDQEVDSIKIRIQDGCGLPLDVISNANGSTPRVRLTHDRGSQFFQQEVNMDGSGFATTTVPASFFKVVALDDPPFVNGSVAQQLQDTTFTFKLEVRDTTDVTIQDTVWTYNPSKTVIIGGQSVFIKGDTSFTTSDKMVRRSLQPRADFVYYGPFDIKIDYESAGAEVFRGCTSTGMGGANDSIILMNVGAFYPLTIEVIDKFSGCPVDTGRIQIYDFVGDLENSPQAIPLKNGSAIYLLQAGLPNIATGGAYPFQKAFYLSITAGARPAEGYGNWIMVRGGRNLTPTYTSRSPEFPDLIVHDPPGDNSFAWVEKGSTYEFEDKTQYEVGGSAGVYVDATFGVSNITDIGFVVSQSYEIAGGVKATVNYTGGRTNNTNISKTNSYSFTENFSTSSDPLFTGYEGDVYIGKSMNQKFSIAKVLSFDPITCTSSVNDLPNLEETGIVTTFIYTEKHIKGVLVPQLRYLGNILRLQASSETDAQVQKDLVAEADSFGIDVLNWESILARNAYNRDTGAVFKENRSFSAGAIYQATVSYDSTTSNYFDYTNFVDINTSVGFAWEVKAGAWSEGSVGIAASFRKSYTRDTGNVKGSNFTVGYQLADKDIGDFFSVDILTDTAFGVPAFKLFAGTSSCPHEEGTQPRDQAKISIIPPTGQTVVPLGGSSLMVAKLINESKSQETREYHVRVIPQTNPDGASISIGGYNINNRSASFFLDAFQTKDVVFEVERGPLAANYSRIGIMMYPPCEYELWENNGNLTSGDTAYISVNFETECSAVSLLKPVNNWLVNANSNNLLIVDFGGFDLQNEFLESLTLEYKVVGQGWQDGPTIAKADFQGSIHRLAWDVTGLLDDQYEIRARANCSLGRGTTYSSALQGTIDRTSIGPFGSPSPSDGFLRLNQDISVTFDGDIECSFLSYATQPDITLIRMDNMTAIPFTVQCSENKDEIILQPTVNLFNMPELEGVEIRAHVMGMEDDNANVQQYPIDWSFVVNASPVFWDPASIDQKGVIGQSNVIAAKLKNQAVITKAFEITDFPAWLTPSSLNGSVLSNGEFDLQFAVDPELPPGYYRDTVIAMVDGWPEILDISYESLAIPPNWVVNPNKYTYSMNMVLAFSLDQGDTNLSRDDRDMIAAIYNGEVRGVTRLEYVPQFNKYMAFLTVYSDIPANEEITFSMWRASTGVEHRAGETFFFSNEQVYGRIGAPEILHPDGVFQVIPLKQGWNWVSLNITNPDMTIHNLLSSLASDEVGNNITVKRKDGKTGTFTQIATPIIFANQWSGELAELDNKQAYLIHLSDAPDTLRVAGQPITNFSTIDMLSGWNWIGFQPQSAQPVLQALNSVNLRNKDLLKGQQVFSEYHKGSDTWYGPLQFMEPGKGYKLRLRSGVLYNDLVYSRLGLKDFEVDHTRFESSMTLIGSVGIEEAGGEIRDERLETLDERLLVGAFIDDTCRGYGFLEYVEFLKAYRVIFSLHGNASDIGRPVTFKLYDTQSGQEFIPNNAPEFFVTDRILGEMTDPYVLFERLALPEAGYVLDQNYPNPYDSRTTIRFIMPQEEQVTLSIYDQMGKEIAVPVNEFRKAGEHSIIFDASELPAGVYHYKIEAGEYRASRKMIKF